jgi:hypothetical protein
MHATPRGPSGEDGGERAPAPPGASLPEAPREPRGALLTAAAALLMLLAIDLAWEPAPAQNLFLRWIRTATGHPIRSGVACFLAIRAFQPAWGIPYGRRRCDPL